MFRFLCVSDGKPTRESWMWQKSKQYPTPPYLIHLCNG